MNTIIDVAYLFLAVAAGYAAGEILNGIAAVSVRLFGGFV